MGLMAFLPMLPIYVREQFGVTGEAEATFWAGIIYGVAPLTAAIFGPIWGSLGDRRGRKAMTLRAIGGIAVVAMLMPLANSTWSLLALRALQGALAGYVAPAMSLVSATTPPDRQGTVIGRLQVGLALGLLAGPALGAEIAHAFGRPAVFYATAIAAGVALVPIMLFAREDHSSLRPSSDHRVRVIADLLELFAAPVFGVLLASLLLFRLGMQMADAFVALLVERFGPLDWVLARADSLPHAIDRTTAFVFVLLALAQVLFTTTWARIGDRFGPLRGLIVVAVGLGATTIASAFATSIEVYVALRGIGAICAAGAATLSYAALGKRIAPTSRSVAFASLQSCMQLGMFLGPLLGGVIAGPIGLSGVLVVSGVLVMASGWAMLIVRRREARRREMEQA